MKKFAYKKVIFSGIGFLILMLSFNAFGQNWQYQNAIRQAQDAVRDKIVKKKGGQVTFPNYSQSETINTSNSRVTVTGYGTWSENYNANFQDFTYEARVNTRNNKVDKIKYDFLKEDDGNGRIPNWAIGTFNARNPQTGGNIAMTINNNGSVVINFGGNMTQYANINGNRLTNNGVVSRVTRINNGIRTTRLDNGEVIDYYSTGGVGGGNAGNVPSWAVGTFYGRNPQNGGSITMTISNMGNVTINFGNFVNNATISGDRLNNGGIISRVTRLNNGIRTTRIDNGEVIDYYSTGGIGSGSGNNNADVPNWAVGTFSARNPQTGGNIILTIASNGNVTINMDGNISYASMSGDRLYNNGIESRVIKTRNGIRTTRVDNGERIDYRKQ